MALWFLRGLRRGVVTTRYPATVDDWATPLPSSPAFRPDAADPERWPTSWSRCARAARWPRTATSLVLDVGACTACGRCLDVAGEAAVPSGEFELAATARSQLVKRIPIGGGPR